MSEESQASSAAAAKLETNFPRCVRCNKPVDTLTISPVPHNSKMVTVEYNCHGESVMQEMPSSILKEGRGLAGYTAFNDYTSGLLPQK